MSSELASDKSSLFEIRDLASVRAINAVPLDERGLAASTYEVIRRAAYRLPDADALVYLSDPKQPESAKRTSYRQLSDSVNQAAHLFRRLGIDRQSVVSILLPNGPEFHYAFWGAEAVGIANPLNPMLSADALVELMEAAGTRILVCLSPQIAPQNRAIIDGLEARLRDITVLTVGGSDQASFADARAKEKPDPITDLPGPDDIASLFQTGGTTGRPKLARHTHANEVFMAWTFANHLGLRPGQTILGGLPLFHVNGVFVTGLGPISGGARTLIATPEGYRNPDLMGQFWSIIERFRVNLFSCVPTILAGLMKLPAGGADISSLRYALCGAAPLSESLLSNFETSFDLKILEGYGLTEGTCASTVNPTHGERRAGSVGLPLPYQDVEIRRPDASGKFVSVSEPGQTGVIFVSGPNVFPGYVDPSANKTALADGWLNTGDLGYLDADGYLWLAGRSKDLIIRGGHNIDPKSIEEALSRHPAVSEVAAVGMPDARLGELPAVFVTLRPGQTATEEELGSFAREQIAERAARPAMIQIVDSLPLTAVGKIFKPELRRILAEQVLNEVLAETGTGAECVVALHDKYGLLVTLKAETRDACQTARTAIEAFPFRIEVQVS